MKYQKENNFPVKYALLPVYEFMTNKIGNKYLDSVCHIVSKAYLLKETKYYNSNDVNDYYTIYNVIFPYRVFTYIINYEQEFSTIEKKDYSIEISEVFDTYEEAVKSRDMKNEFYCPVFVEKYLPLEKEIIKLTENMENENVNSKEKIKIKK